MCISMDEVEISRMRSSVWIQLRPLSLPNVRHDPTVNPDEEWIIGGNRAAQVATGISRCSDIGASLARIQSQLSGKV